MSSTGDLGDITRLLQDHRRGSRGAFDKLVPMVYGQLREVARRQLRRLPRGETLNTTGLVHEAYMQLVDETGVDWQNRGHFLAVSARAMRRIAVDHARHRSAQKRGGGIPAVTLEPEHALGTCNRKVPVWPQVMLSPLSGRGGVGLATGSRSSAAHQS